MQPEILGTTVKKSVAQATHPRIYALLLSETPYIHVQLTFTQSSTAALGDPLHTRTTYTQGNINSIFKRPCTYTYNLHSSDHQQQLVHLLQFEGQTRAYFEILDHHECWIQSHVCHDSALQHDTARHLFQLPFPPPGNTHKTQTKCVGLLHQYSSNLFIWKTISFTSNIHGKHQHLLLKMMKGNIHETTNIRYSCTSTHHNTHGWVGGIAPLHLNLGTRWRCAGNLMPRLLYSLQTATCCTHCSEDVSVSPTAGLNIVQRTKIFCPCRDSNPWAIHPVA